MGMDTEQTHGNTALPAQELNFFPLTAIFFCDKLRHNRAIV
jgi:hypothetical protein